MLPDNTVLDRSVISTLTTKFSREQEALVKALTKSSSSSPSNKSDYETWLRLRQKIDSSNSQLHELLEKVDKNEPKNSRTECDAAQLALAECRETYRILSVIHDICQRLHFRNGFGVESLEKDAETLIDLRRVLKGLGKEERCGLKVVSVLKAKRAEIQSALIAKIEQEWTDLIEVSENRLQMNPDRILMKDVIECAKRLQIFPTLVKTLANILLNRLIVPLADGDIICSLDDKSEKSLTLLRQSSNQSTVPTEQSSSVSRLSQLRNLFSFLKTQLFILDSSTNFELAAALGAEISQNLACDVVRRRCLAEALSSDFDQFQSMKSAVLDQLRELREILLKLNWISGSDNDWNFDSTTLEDLYASKCGEQLVVHARRLYQSETDFLDVKKIRSKDEPLAEDDFCLFRLQDMSVSTSVAIVAEDCQSLLEWPTSKTSLRCGISAVYNSFAMIVDIVPYYFQDRLVSIPTLGALYFTSCIYGSWQLGIFNRIVQKSPVVTSDRDPDSNWTICFLDLILKLRSKAYGVLTAMIENYSREVVEVINSGQTAWLTKLAQNHLQNLLDQAVLNRGLEVIRRLADHWRPIFPALVYQQTIGLIIDAVLRAATSRVIAVEDINATDSAALCRNFQWLLAESITLIKVGDTVESAPFKHVPSWMTFKEIIFVLDASMGQIADRWADHSGPLAEHLSPEELKRLIRALFENNDKRARLLATIK